MNLEKAEDHLGIVFVDKVPNQTVLDAMTGATKKVDQVNILMVVPDIDDVIAGMNIIQNDNLSKLVSPIPN